MGLFRYLYLVFWAITVVNIGHACFESLLPYFRIISRYLRTFFRFPRDTAAATQAAAVLRCDNETEAWEI